MAASHPRSLRQAPRRLCAAALLVLAGLPPVLAATVAGYAQVRRSHLPSDIELLDREGAPLQRVRVDRSVRRGAWITLPEISPALRTALVLSEDRRFHEHSGVDWRAVSAAAWGNLWNTRTRGASTITMQLAGLLDEELRRGAGGRGIGQKLDQALAARELERGWRKDQILEAYLNLVPLRGELVGVDALARTLFDKAPHGLDSRESAIAAALVRAPNAPPARVAQRACELLLQLEAPTDAARSCAGLDLYTDAVLRRRAYEPSAGIAPHLARHLAIPGLAGAAAPASSAAADGTRTLRTSLRAPLQRFVLATLQQQLRELQGRQVQDGAVVVLDNRSGEVLAWVGSSGMLSAAPEVDGADAPRQPGSTLKPFLYAQAIAERRLTAASLLEDSPAAIQTAGGLYIPRNYDNRFRGWVSVREALAASLNVPAVRTLEMVSPEAFHARLRAFGLPLARSGDWYGYSLALGSAEVRLGDLANAYRALANGARPGPMRFVPQPPDTAAQPTVLDPQAAWIVADILADPLARATTFGSDSVLATPFWSAVKTGTSKDMRDNWAIGFSRRYTVGVWVGNASGVAMHAVSGSSGAAPVWAAVMRELHRAEPSLPPPAPAGLARMPVHFDAAEGGLRTVAAAAPRLEWFLPGTGQPSFARHRETLPAARPARILSPAAGTVVALDPDIPPRNQRVQLRAEGGGTELRWSLDGRPLASGREAGWLPWPGRHTLRLSDARGMLLDEVRIEVRGAGLRPPQPAGERRAKPPGG